MSSEANESEANESGGQRQAVYDSSLNHLFQLIGASGGGEMTMPSDTETYLSPRWIYRLYSSGNFQPLQL